MLAEYKRKSSIAAYACLALILLSIVAGFFGLQPKTQAAQLFGAILGCLVGIAFLCSAWFYVKAKGRSAWWLLVLFLNLVGIVILALLKDRAPEELPPGAVP